VRARDDGELRDAADDRVDVAALGRGVHLCAERPHVADVSSSASNGEEPSSVAVWANTPAIGRMVDITRRR